MTLESAAIAVGKALGTHIAHTWLAGRSADQDGRKDLAALVRTRFPDRIARRRFDRQITDIADQVAERLLSLCGPEYGGLAENDKAAALAEVVRTLTEADLSDRALFAADLDPVRVAAHVRAGLPRRAVEGQLGEAGAHLYDVVLDECCDCLVRVVVRLPQFGPRATAETLNRLSGVSAQVATLLARLPVRTLDAPEGTATDEAFRRRYLEHVSANLDVLELFGVRVERYRPRTTLSVAYISLSVAADGHTASSRGLQLDEWRKGEPEPGEATLRVETALGRAPLTLIRGEAGSGKSTLLRWLAISAARATFTGDLAEWNGRVPFLIKLRSHTGARLPSPERFLEGVADPIAGLMPAGWAHRRLQEGRVLLLVDGVDELPGAERRAVRPWLAGLIAAYPGLRAVVTSRPAAAGSDWLAAEGFATALLERMTPTDIKALIRHWHEAVHDSGDLPCAPGELPGFEAALLARMESAPHLRSLAGSPLLAAMLCALNLDREKQLPRDRMGLYAAALELLLERRDAERQIQADESLERSQKMQILQDLAWRLSIFGRTELPKETVVGRTGEKLAAMPNAPAGPEAIVDHLLQRSGVLREPVPGRIDFVHRTVQEYLTAKQFADDGDLEPLISQAHKDQWRETVIMAAGHANAPQRAELLRGLLARIGTEKRNARRLKLLVAGCLETLPAIPADLRADVEACLDDLVPPRDLASARTLSNVGDPILRRLPRTSEGLSAAVARAVIRTAWLVNGPEALELIAGYGHDDRDTVQRELAQAWEYFDPDLYARRVLADTPLVDGNLVTRFARSTSAARHIRHLRSLYVYREAVPDLSFLNAMNQPLTSLSVLELQSEDLRPLETLTESLLVLKINCRTTILDFAPLSRLPKLNSLDLGSADLSDLSFLETLPKLRRLSLYSLQPISDWSPLGTQDSLRSLSLIDCVNLTDLDSLPSLKKTTALSLTGSTLECDPGALKERAPGLIQLTLNQSPWVSDLRSLSASNLTYLGLWGCRGITEFSPLAQLTDLFYLDLEDTNIGDLAPLSGLVNLETLWLRKCENVTDLSPLRRLENLRSLYIADIAPDVDLAPLADLHGITIYTERDQKVRNRAMLGRRVKMGIT